MNTCGLMAELAHAVRDAVLPHLGSAYGRTVTGLASSGDTTFQIDEVAEEAIEGFMIRQRLPWAVYTEDRGLRVPGGGPYDRVLIIDPIDGTRSAMAGLEACVVSIAATPGTSEPRFGDVDAAVVLELRSGECIAAAIGDGVTRTARDGKALPLLRRESDDPNRAGLAVDVVGAPLGVVFQVLDDLVSGCTLRGGCFVLNSTAFELTRLVTGQLSAVVDIRARLMHDAAWLQTLFNAHGGGRPIALCPYDAAAAAFIALQMGVSVTDAYGRSIDGWELLDTSAANFGTLIAAVSPALHGAILTSVDRGFTELQRRPHAQIEDPKRA